MSIVHPTQQLGATAELLVAYRFAEAGRLVSWPLVKCKYDLIVDGGDGLFRVQVKSGHRPPDGNRYYVHLDKSGGHRVPLPTDFDVLVIVCEPNEVYVIPTGMLRAQPDRTALIKSVCLYPESERFAVCLNQFGLGSGTAPQPVVLRPGAEKRTHWFTPVTAGTRKRYRRLSLVEIQAIQHLPIAFFHADEGPGLIPLRQVAQQYGVHAATLRNLLRGRRKDLASLTGGTSGG